MSYLQNVSTKFKRAIKLGAIILTALLGIEKKIRFVLQNAKFLWNESITKSLLLCKITTKAENSFQPLNDNKSTLKFKTLFKLYLKNMLYSHT